MIHNLISLSGGKDSTAMALLAMEQEVENVSMVFADTGHESPQTYEYLDYLEEEFYRRYRVFLRRVQADFSKELAQRRAYIDKHWRAQGVPDAKVDRAMQILQPSGSPFFDLCMLKYKFPSMRTQFCSGALKKAPINEQVVEDLLHQGQTQAVISWIGVRAQESPRRAKLKMRAVEFGTWEPEPKGLLRYHPILHWTSEQVFDLHRKHGLRWNPLYEQSLSRVGCLPCIFARQKDIAEIGRRFPEAVEKIREWEALMAELVPSSTQPTFFSPYRLPKGQDRADIDTVLKWAEDPEAEEPEQPEGAKCSSVYGLCE